MCFDKGEVDLGMKVEREKESLRILRIFIFINLKYLIIYKYGNLFR